MCQEISKCRRLRELGLNHVENITPFGLKFIQRLPRLEKLLLFHAHHISPLCFEQFFSSENLRNLVSDLIPKWAKMTSAPSLDKHHLKSIRTKYSALCILQSYVNLSGCKGADRSLERTIRKNCPRIRDIIFHVHSARETAYIDFGIYNPS